MNANRSNSKGGKSGNTKQISPSKRWCFTLNNYSEQDYLDIINMSKIHSSKYIIGKEIGEDKKTPHLQGYIEFNKKTRPLTEHKICGCRIHWEKSKGTAEDNYFYCSKENKFIADGDWKIKKKVKTLDVDKMYPFQKSIIDIYKGDINENKIIWIYDPKGQLGKTEMIRYMNVTYGVPFAYGGKCADIINLAFNNKEYLECAEKPCFMYNIGRDITNNKISYASMEQISDGAIANTKFEAGCFVFNKPHVIVFANCKPLYSKLTKSRWVMKTINDKKELIDMKIDDSDDEDE